MATPDGPEGDDAILVCAMCKKLIPASTAVSPEGHDYVLHFCGPKCRADWEREQGDELERAHRARSGVDRG